MALVFDRVGMSTTTAGTGALTLGAPLGNVSPNLAPFMSFASAGVANGQTVSYLILDANNNWEVGIGTYTSSGTTLSRTPLWSSNANAAINLSGNAQVFITEIAEDVNQAAYGGYRNRFRNANFDVAQRGTSGSVSAGATAYTIDGWQVSPTGAAVLWNQEYFNAIGNNHLLLSCASGITACTVQQRIESTVAESMLLANGAAQSITIQWTIYNTSGATFTPQIAVDDATAQDNFTSVSADLAATNLQLCLNGGLTTVAYTYVPSVSLKNGMQVRLLLGGALNQASGNVRIGLADIRPTPGVATGLNNNPPPPELRPIHTEYVSSRRFLRGYNGDVIGYALNISSLYSPILLDPPMRAAPNLLPGASFSVNAGSAGTPATQAVTAGGVSIFNSATNWTTNAVVLLTGLLSAEL